MSRIFSFWNYKWFHNNRRIVTNFKIFYSKHLIFLQSNLDPERKKYTCFSFIYSPAKFNCFKMLDVLLIFFKKRTITIKNTLVLMMNQIHQIKYDVSSTLYWTNMYIGSWLTLVSSWDCFCHEDSKHKTLKTPIGHKY